MPLRRFVKAVAEPVSIAFATSTSEAALPRATVLYLQGTCGDVNFRREFNGTERRFEPATAITKVALEALDTSRPIEQYGIGTVMRKVTLPTRRWTREDPP